MTKKVWFESKFGLHSDQLPQDSLIEWWNALVNDLQQLRNAKEEFVLCIFLLWQIWKARNEVVFNRNHMPTSLIVSKAAMQNQEYIAALHKRSNLDGMSSTRSTVQTNPPVWVPPPIGFHKVNFDGAIDMNLRTGAIGFVVSDFAGNFILAGARRFMGIIEPMVIEALALRTSMEEVLSITESRLIFEGDCQVLINAVNSSSSTDRDAGVVLEDILSLVSRLTEIRFQYVNRKCNWVAHLVAKKALVDDCFCSSHHSVLEWLTQNC
ncbi:uncharacterized protein LOC126687955 [Mercurialis annua]|uniref:uncharacterized protein LOC126687955 n=1 Tax=Mercurialis annua TaxID=3986 RepID=UPI00215FDD1D|nr:uncharacterized protein LOC126687955 [Mercurialis annua]